MHPHLVDFPLLVSCKASLVGIQKHGRRGLALAVLGLSFGLGLLEVAQASSTIGYAGVDDPDNSNSDFVSGMSSSSAYLIQFAFQGLGDYSLDSVQLMLDGNADLSDFSVMATSTLPNDLTLPASLTTFSTTGTLDANHTVYSFAANTPMTLTDSTPYYLRVSYTGPDTANWIRAAGNPGSGSTGSGAFVLTLVQSELTTQGLNMREVTSGGPNNLVNAIPGFSITASAIPEPGTLGLLATGLALTALYIRRRRSRR